MIVALTGVARPAAADDLVTNLSTSASGREGLADSEYIQSFTTGPNVSGYLLESISIDFVKGSVGARDPVYVYLYEDNGSGRPRSRAIATLTKNGVNFAPPVTGVNKYKVWKARCYPQPPHGGGCLQDPSSVHLAPNTTYWVYVWAGRSTTGAELQSDTATTESGATGWTLGDSAFSKPSWGSSDGVYTYTSISAPLLIKVEGTTNPEVLVSINDVTVTEGTHKTADFVVSLSRKASGPVQVSYETFDQVGSSPADEGSDYEATSGTLTFRPGQTRKTVSVPILDDARNEGNETFGLVLTNLQGATFDGNTGTGTILNADPLTLSISDATATEGVDATIDFTVSLNRATTRRITVNILFSSDTADFSDITQPDQTSVTFEPGQRRRTYSLGIVDDTENEPSETFSMVLQVPGFFTADLIVGPPGAGTILNTETLEASFENVPQDHDGSNTFTFNVAFTNDVSITPAAMRDHAFTVTNGDVTGASRVDGRSDRWLITVDPDGDDAVTITLPGNRACGTQGAICSKEDNPVQLSHSPSATVAAPPEGDPLTASFSNVPDSHDGSDFHVDLTFSEGPDVGYRDVQKAVKVSGGSINRANRKTKGSNVGWKLKVRPTGTDSLTIRLPATTNCSARGAICTEDGRRLTNSPSATVAGPAAVVETTPTVSIAGGSGTEGDDDSIAFTVTLDEAASETVTVDYATADGSAEAGDDYTATSGTLSFSAGDTRKTIPVAISDDTDNEGDETFTVTLSNAAGADLGTKTATGTIRNRPVAPLTASFSGVPAEHTGEEFTFALTFSGDVAGLSYLTLRDDALSATGGTVQRARRQQQGSNQAWTIHVEPAEHTAVTVRLPAGSVESSDGRALSHSLSATVAGPVGISVADARVTEGPGAVLAFAVTLSRAASGTVTLDYATADGTATAGADYTATSGTLTFQAGESSKTVNVAVLDDLHDDGGETLTLTLSNASEGWIEDGTATGTIENTDPLQRAWLARFGRTVGTHVTDAISDRLRGGSLESHLTIGGQRMPFGKQAVDQSQAATSGATAESGGSALLQGVVRLLGLNPAPHGSASDDSSDSRPRLNAPLGQSPTPHIDLRRILLGSSFRLALGADAADSSHPSLTAWGRFAGTQFDGNESDLDLSLDGDVLTGTVGIDGAWDRLLLGIAVAHSRGDGSFTGTGRADAATGDLKNTLTSFHPYLRYAVTDRLDVWGTVGYGWGELTVDQHGGSPLEADMNLLMGSFGSRGVLLTAEENGGFQLATRTDAMLTRTTSDDVVSEHGNLAGADADAHRVRLILEGSRAFTLAEGRSFVPTLELGVRHDWGDAETGFGLELGGRVQYADPGLGLTIEGTVRGLLAHEDSDYQEWGASGNIRLAPGPGGRGLSLTLAPTWGAAASGVDGLWSRQTTAGLAPQGNRQAPAGRLTAEAGYGLTLFDTGVLTPYAGTVLSDGSDRTWRVGSRWRGGTGLEVTVEGVQQASAGQHPVTGLRLQATWGAGGQGFTTLTLDGQRQPATGAQPGNQGFQLQLTWGF